MSSSFTCHEGKIGTLSLTFSRLQGLSLVKRQGYAMVTSLLVGGLLPYEVSAHSTPLEAVQVGQKTLPNGRAVRPPRGNAATELNVLCALGNPCSSIPLGRS